MSLSDALSNEELKRLIERAAKLRRIKLEELPLADLKRWLESNWGPSISELVLPRSIASEQLVDNFVESVPTGERKANWGTTSGTYTTGTTPLVTVNHGLGVAPTFVVVHTRFLSGIGYFAGAVNIPSINSTSFQWGGVQLGTLAHNGAVDHHWQAII